VFDTLKKRENNNLKEKRKNSSMRFSGDQLGISTQHTPNKESIYSIKSIKSAVDTYDPKNRLLSSLNLSPLTNRSSFSSTLLSESISPKGEEGAYNKEVF
jgi:hypothetical protein